MKIRTDATYQFNDKYQGSYQLELFNEHYLSVNSKRLNKKRQFKMEVATLDPEAKKVEIIPWQWLIAGLASLAGAGYLLYFLLSSAEGNTVWFALGGASMLLLLCAVLIITFWHKLERKWVFETRASHCPLVVIPFNKANTKEAQRFVEQLQAAVEHTNSQKGYSSEDLFAGEMRMLRRLSKSGVISDRIYDSAKKEMLGAGAQSSVAAA